MSKQRYNVHVYREMKLRFDDIEAETPEAAAEAARERESRVADELDDCDGDTLSALVDEVGDEEYARSRLIDFEAGRRLAQASAMHAALEQIARMRMDGEHDADGMEFILENDDAVDSLHSCIRLAREALAGA